MGWKGTVRSLQASARRSERNAHRRQRELEKRQKEYAKMEALEQARRGGPDAMAVPVEMARHAKVGKDREAVFDCLLAALGRRERYAHHSSGTAARAARCAD